MGSSGDSTSMHKRPERKSYICMIFGKNSIAIAMFLSETVLPRFLVGPLKGVLRKCQIVV